MHNLPNLYMLHVIASSIATDTNADAGEIHRHILSAMANAMTNLGQIQTALQGTPNPDTRRGHRIPREKDRTRTLCC